MQKQWQDLFIDGQEIFGNMEGLAKALSKSRSSKARRGPLLMLKKIHKNPA